MSEFDRPPLVGIGYRFEIHDWIVANLWRFDVLEVTIDHYLVGGGPRRAALSRLVERIPLVAHGVGLSVGTALPPDLDYLDRVAGAIAALKMPSYSEHLAFTKAPGLDLANLLPLPRTEEVAAHVIENVAVVRAHVPVPLQLENISYLFNYPDSTLDEVAFLNLVCRETGAGVLLDVENLYLNSRNHGYDPYAFVDALPQGAVKGIHTAGGCVIDGTPVDTHDHRVPEEAMALLAYVLRRQSPATIILERDNRIREVDEIVSDVNRIREVATDAARHPQHVQTTSARSPV